MRSTGVVTVARSAARRRIRAAVAGVPGARRLRSAYRVVRSHSAPDEVAAQLQFSQDEFLYFRGTLWVTCWVWHPAGVAEVALTDAAGQLVRVQATRHDSPDLVAHFGEAARRNRFTFTCAVADAVTAAGMRLTVVLVTGERIVVADATGERLAAEPVHQLTSRFHELVSAVQSPRVLEIGARARSGNVYRDWLPDSAEYVGFDVLAGPNVDVVGDAHELSKHIEHGTFDAVCTTATFEHLAMPWLVALEINKVLRTGGYVYVAAPQTWPLHDLPWDFWRFSTSGWSSLFNRSTGFEIVAAEMGEPALTVPRHVHTSTAGLEDHPSYLWSTVIARKVSETGLSWDVQLDRVLDVPYPQ